MKNVAWFISIFVFVFIMFKLFNYRNTHPKTYNQEAADGFTKLLQKIAEDERRLNEPRRHIVFMIYFDKSRPPTDIEGKLKKAIQADSKDIWSYDEYTVAAVMSDGSSQIGNAKARLSVNMRESLTTLEAVAMINLIEGVEKVKID